MGVSYLLDTHTIVWLAGHGGPPMGDALQGVLEDADNALLISSVSAFEVSTKVRIGKLDSARALFDRWDSVALALRAQPLALDDKAALLAGSMSWPHRDPFDRLLAAQAITAGLTLVTADPAFESAPGLSLLRWGAPLDS